MKMKKYSKCLVDSKLFHTFATLLRAECCCSSVVEHFLGKEEVTSSSLVNSSKRTSATYRVAFAVFNGAIQVDRE